MTFLMLNKHEVINVLGKFFMVILVVEKGPNGARSNPYSKFKLSRKIYIAVKQKSLF